MKESFANFTSTVLETLVSEAPAIGLDKKKFQDKVISFDGHFGCFQARSL